MKNLNTIMEGVGSIEQAVWLLMCYQRIIKREICLYATHVATWTHPATASAGCLECIELQKRLANLLGGYPEDFRLKHGTANCPSLWSRLKAERSALIKEVLSQMPELVYVVEDLTENGDQDAR